MEYPVGKGLDGLAKIVVSSWFSAMGLVGLILFFTALVIDLPTDRTTVICIALIMFGYGFGQSECRTFRESIGHGYKITGPAWKWTISGILLFAIAIGAAITLALHLSFSLSANQTTALRESLSSRLDPGPETAPR